MKIYVISKDESRYNRTVKELINGGFHRDSIHHFPGFDGNLIRQKGVSSQLTRFCHSFCTDKMIGCGTAHIRLSQHIFQNDSDEYTLIVEDDIKSTGVDLPHQIDQVTRGAPPNWDSILLFCQGNCRPNARLLVGSTAAYLISRKGAEKMSKLRLNYHIDWQRNGLKFNTVVGPQLFSTFDPKMPPTILNQSWLFWSNQEVFRLLGVSVKLWHWVLVVGVGLQLTPNKAFYVLVLLAFHVIFAVVLNT